MNAAVVSSQKIKDHYSLPGSNPTPFVRFRDEVNERCIRRSAVNPLSFKDVIAEGTKKLESRELHIRRFRQFAREQRRRNIDEAVYREQKKYSVNGVEDEDTVMEMAKLNLNVLN